MSGKRAREQRMAVKVVKTLGMRGPFYHAMKQQVDAMTEADVTRALKVIKRPRYKVGLS